jgi:hypothetical protein
VEVSGHQLTKGIKKKHLCLEAFTLTKFSKPSLADSHIRCFKHNNISETNPISIITTLIMETAAVSEALACSTKCLMQLPAQEDFTEPTSDLE